MSHTPGTWEVRLSREAGSSKWAEEWREIWSGRHCVISPSGFQRSYDGESETIYGVRISEDDANLIAAAPVMLQVLKDIDAASWEINSKLGERIRGAIRQAEGETN